MANYKTLLRLLAFVALGFSADLSVAAEKADEAPKKEISDSVSSELAKLKEKVDAKDYPGAVQLLDGILATAKHDTYDVAMVSQIKAQILLTEGKYADAIPSLITAQELGDKYAFFDKRAQLDRLYLLSQIHYQLAADTKDITKQGKFFASAYDYIHKWLLATPKPTVEAELFASSILYGSAVLDPNKPNRELLQQARVEANRGLYLSTKPNDQIYVLLLASVQQLGDNAAAAELLEILVTKQPKNSTYWQQLAAIYQALSGQTTDEKEIRRLQLRMIVTIQRAQSNGIMNTPKDNLNLIGLYFNLEQYGRAGELLAQGLKSGQIENTRANWELLSTALQQSGHDEQALSSLKEAADLFPTEGQLELTLGQMYYGSGRADDAFHHLQRAVEKGNLKKPGAAYLFLGFVAFELQKYEQAAKYAEVASKQSDVKPEDATRLGRAAQEALKDRESLKSAKT